MNTTQEFSRPDLVRRFTAELEDDSDLASQVKSYQGNLDAEINAQEKLRMDRIYYGPTSIESSFKGLELARQTLQSKCDEFFKSLDEKVEAEKSKSGFSRLMHRNATEQKLASYIRQRGELTVTQVTSIVNEVETQWTESNSKAATNFVKICQKFDAHKQIFQCFPSQTSYTSALCGAITMVVQASVNYSTIAERLSGYIAELSESIAVCTQWLDLYDNPAMQERLSDIYTQYFHFFIKVATWYMKPKPSKWLDSFNSNFTTGYEDTTETIKRSIRLIRDQALIENAWQLNKLDQSFMSFEKRLAAWVNEIRNEKNEAGGTMATLMLQMTERIGLWEERFERMQLQGQDKTGRTTARGTASIKEAEIAEVDDVPRGLSRSEAKWVCQHLQPKIDQMGGFDGIRLALQTGRLIAEPTIVQILGNWAQATSGNTLNLWIISPFETGPQTSAQLAALGVIWTAIRARAQFVSYICQRPQYGSIPEIRNIEDKAGVMAMVYSLICQLLQFQPPDDRVHLQPEMLDRLTQPGERWTTGLTLLKYLLENTPTLRYCIISGINLLEGSARDMCQEFVDLLFAHSRNADWPVRILFTTSGQSRALDGTVDKESKVMSHSTFHQMKGRLIYRDVQMSG
ncbi:hypothetical protein PCG10_001444 [Penicillium crustosum]|uniref:DUF7708 domain-containing protein n=1 Tax=Penicillium crustosum TaxID=36656 RepID=A0A9P5GRM9_PENCR|nr:uncharacterized protein N7487_001969 [Penicillium crustosum]KAF7528156.1 hypothetical protein PCG10_001444 [Penicillium crustosum]KAJ5418419.1 hypothetical protein N7487_001969 [Penicillium crustosum]